MIKPLVRSMLSSMITTIIDGTLTNASRRFLEWDSTANTYGELSAPITFTGDFSISIDFATTDTSTVQAVIAGVLNTTNAIMINIDTDGMLKAYCYIGEIVSSLTSLNVHNVCDGKLHTVKLVNTSGAVELFYDGVSVGTDTWGLNGNQNIGRVGGRETTGQWFNGTLANLIIDNNGTTLSWALDSETSTEYPAENVIGSELVTNGTFDTDVSGWSVVNGTIAWASGIEITSGSSVARIEQSYTFDANKVYLLTVDVIGVSTSVCDLYNYCADETTRIGYNITVGTYTHIFNGGTDRGINIRVIDTLGETVTLDNISIVEITNAITYYNLTTRWDATQVGNDWVGVDLWTHGQQNLATSAVSDIQTGLVDGNVYIVTDVPAGVHCDFGSGYLAVPADGIIEATGTTVKFRNISASNPIVFTPAVKRILEAP